MMSDHTAQVIYQQRLVGMLRVDGSREMYLTYSDSWLNGPAFPISNSLPLSEREMYAHTFFAGLLPEEKVRQRVCRRLGIDERDDAGLLMAIGGDCAGALSIIPGEELASNDDPKRMLGPGALARLVKSFGSELPQEFGEQRFSLAGAQEKQSVIVENDTFFWPTRQHPSTHILKFETLPRVCFAEYMANKVAEKIGLNVVATEFRREETEATPFLKIERFDRAQAEAGGGITRIHQEDMLQELGEPTALKYQADGGPTLASIAEVIRSSVAESVTAILQLRDWQIFNFLIGNWDGHAKNLALLYGEDGAAPTLAPFYDLVAIEFFNVLQPGQWSRKLAFKIGQHDTPEEVTLKDWAGFAAELSIPPRPTIKRLGEVADLLPQTVRQELKVFAEDFGAEQVFDQFEHYVSGRCHWVRNQIAGGKY